MMHPHIPLWAVLTPHYCRPRQPSVENQHLWGRRWQADLAQDKTQVMLISRRHHPPATPIPPILLDGRFALAADVNILGVEVNSTLSFKPATFRKTASKARRQVELRQARLPPP
ncbi:hypothetical protein GWK47_054425 [Chionoecetes opilio]|uniref:Uncharacterized protein n=1 Tax=Chionoecetes opilio TaxID=41210 RepID=A0A8J4XYW7_CHIOP|nr:hypothetical protein GWK47_054425 [Chionoecetes opilio]